MFNKINISIEHDDGLIIIEGIIIRRSFRLIMAGQKDIIIIIISSILKYKLILTKKKEHILILVLFLVSEEFSIFKTSKIFSKISFLKSLENHNYNFIISKINYFFYSSKKLINYF